MNAWHHIQIELYENFRHEFQSIQYQYSSIGMDWEMWIIVASIHDNDFSIWQNMQWFEILRLKQFKSYIWPPHLP